MLINGVQSNTSSSLFITPSPSVVFLIRAGAITLSQTLFNKQLVRSAPADKYIISIATYAIIIFNVDLIRIAVSEI